MYHVRLDKHRATWHWFTTNPQGGGYGSNHCGSLRVALGNAVSCVPKGSPYALVINGKARGTFTGGAALPQRMPRSFYPTVTS